MAWTTADLEALNKSIATGATSVRYQDRTVQYRSLEEMMKIRALMMDELGLPGSMKGEIRRLHYSKGITA